MGAPPYPYFMYAGNALYRAGDFHRKRASLSCFDILLVEYGCLYMVEAGNHYKVQANDMLVLSPFRTHSSYKVCDQETYFHWLHFNAAGTYIIEDNSYTDKNHLRKENKKETLILPIFQNLPSNSVSGIIHLMNTLESYTIDRYDRSNMVLRDTLPHSNQLKQQSIFLDFLSEITISDNMPKGNQIALTIMQYLNTNYHHEITLEDLSLAANCHPTHVIRCFNAEYNTTPIKMLTLIRIEHAKKMLLTSDYSCSVIAEEVGFSTSAYFSKVFTNHVGISPQKYRRQGT